MSNPAIRIVVGSLFSLLPSISTGQDVMEGVELAAPEAAYQEARQVQIKTDEGLVTVPYYNIEDMAVFEGDILLGTAEELALVNLFAGVDFEQFEQQAGETGEGSLRDSLGARGSEAVVRGLAIKRNFGGRIKRWPNKTVPYVFERDFRQEALVRQAIRHWEDATDIRFVERTQQNERDFPDFVKFHRPSEGCSSFVGMQGGGQVINLAQQCGLGAAIHEIGHAVGLGHEHTRSDRDGHVVVSWENIQPRATFNFEKNPGKYVDIGSYDYSSIMHYGGFGFALDRTRPTIVSRNGAPIGQRRALSAGDRAAVAAMYGN